MGGRAARVGRRAAWSADRPPATAVPRGSSQSADLRRFICARHVPPAMADGPRPETEPPIDEIAAVFDVYQVRRDGDRVLYFGEFLAPRDAVLRRAWSAFRERGYEATFTKRHGEDVLVAEPVAVGVDGVPWTNVVLFVLTVVSTLYAGSMGLLYKVIADGVRRGNSRAV